MTRSSGKHSKKRQSFTSKAASNEWFFAPLTDNTSFVSITEAGFSGDGDEVIKQALESTGGFTWVLAGLKALLEHNIHLNLAMDRIPEGLENDK